MTATPETNIWLWQDPDTKHVDVVTEFVKRNITDGKELVILNSTQNSVSNSQYFIEYILLLCQRSSLLENERTTYLNYKDHLLALELCIAQTKRKKNLEADVTKNEVLECHAAYESLCFDSDKIVKEHSELFTNIHNEHIQAYKEFLKHSNCTDIWYMLSLIKTEKNGSKFLELTNNNVFLIVGRFVSEVFIHLTRILNNSDMAFNLIVESSLNSSFDMSCDGSSKVELNSASLSKDYVNLREISISPSLVVSISATMEYAEEVMLAFLCLLVNSRNELSLSRAMTSPIVDLSHSAFTDLKHASLQKEMPLCQTVISYIMRIRLGGEGYAPPKDCPLRCHLKELTTFVDLLNQLQTILEEEEKTEVAIKRVINIIKKRFIKCKKNMNESSIGEAAQNLVNASCEVLKRSDLSEGNEAFQYGHEAFKALYYLVNYRSISHHCFDPETAFGKTSVKRTPLNLPPLLGYFRSPEEDSCSQSSLPKDDFQESLPVKENSSRMSYFHCSNSNNSTQSSSKNESTPRKITFKNCLSNNQGEKRKGLSIMSGNIVPDKKPFRNIEHKAGTKRTIFSDNLGENKKTKKSNSSAAATKKKTLSKTKVQIKGQGQITAFFKM